MTSPNYHDPRQPASPYKMDLPAGHLRSYWPHLAHWLAAGYSTPILERRRGVFDVRENLAPDDDVRPTQAGRLIATVHVDPVFGPASASRIARLMSMAPQLWRVLRNVAPFAMEGGSEALETFHQAERLLWHAAGQRPYECPAFNEDDEKTRRLMTIEAGGGILEHADDRD